MMKQRICQFLFYRVIGWKSNVTVEIPEKCLVCMAPHTSNWDLLIGKLFAGAHGITGSFMMKKDWFFFPLGILFRAMGGIPVDRSRKSSLTEQMAERFRTSQRFLLTITPEGTRKANPDWKKGFYYIARGANVPVLLMGFDFPTRTLSITKQLTLTDNVEECMREMKEHFKQYKGKHPEKFAV